MNVERQQEKAPNFFPPPKNKGKAPNFWPPDDHPVKSKANKKLSKLADEMVDSKKAVKKMDIVGPDGKTIGYALYLSTTINMHINTQHKANCFIL